MPSSEVEDVSVCLQKPELPLKLKEDLNAIEENLVQIARLRKLEVEPEQKVLQTRLAARQNLEEWKPVLKGANSHHFCRSTRRRLSVNEGHGHAETCFKEEGKSGGLWRLYGMEGEGAELDNAASGSDPLKPSVGLR